ncbi:hypothetical protein QUC31_004659 [Theobroma cacao]|uniref:Acyl-CoA N-acyltransferase with RING/FYVE/PHD-type zinc finger protein, putative isoform 2 n=1 Tax=Theobroma cacao TaxID=3641 RepID=A0A061DPX0_THECC|nr:Acyl-CoA N-acyltransferase with RING/FYVE/PHD-type zinc finger protein, putative isoform 2 [Theobroma cacao]
MEGGLGSGHGKPEEDKVLPSQDTEENKGDDLKQKGFDLNDEPLVSSLKEVDIEKKEEIEECRGDGEVGNQKVGELNENERKKSRVEDGEDNKEDDSVKKKFKGEGLEGKVQFSRRVLRSRFAVKNGSEKDSNKGESGGNKTGDSNGCEKKTVEVVKEENDHSHGEAKEAKRNPGRRPGMKCSDGDERKAVSVDRGLSNHSDGGKVGKKAKRKRGRPPKFHGNNGFENKAVELQVGESDHLDGEMRKEFKHKRGRPPKVPGKGGFEKKTVEMEARENDHLDGEVRKELKHKRGRPPKVLGNGGFDKKAVKMEAGENDHFGGDVSKQSKRKRGRPPKVQVNGGFEKTVVKVGAVESDQSDGEGSKESKHKRGRPTKVQRDQGIEKKAVEVKARESYHSDVETRKEAKYKHGGPPMMHSNNGFEMKVVEVKMGEGDHFDCELRKEVKNKRGRPPKVRSGDGLEKKWVELDREGSDHNNAKLRKGVIRKRGRPPKLQVGDEALEGKLIDGRKKLGGLRRGRKKSSGSLKFNVPANTSYSEKRLIGKESNMKRYVSANKVRFEYVEKNESKASLMLRPKVVMKSKEMRVKKAGDSKQRDEVEQRRSDAKRAVRDRIVKLLKAAGWTIDYRPRSNRQYNDAVYVNPEGKTHWSVTLAYRMLKKYYESDDSVSEVSPNGFIFTPIPEEDLSILTRVVRKKRLGKKKPKSEDDDMLDDGKGERKMYKRKNKWKGNGDKEHLKRKKRQKLLKEKFLLHEEDNSDGTLQKATQASGKKSKFQQTQKKGQYALLVRNSMGGAESDNDGYVLYDGKRTVLAWMIDLGTVPQDGKVEYLIQRRTRTTREGKSGRITRDGIQCNCCSVVFTVAEFETHAGSKLHQPFLNICLETGTPLLQCLLDAWNKLQQSNCKGFHYVDFGGEDPNDDTCGICGDGGDLICCDSCPSTFHQSCLDIKAFPSGNWHCVYCACKYCGMVGNALQRDKDEEIDPAVLTCHLCEEKYHQPCIQTMDALDDESSGASFCGKKCKELFERLQTLIGVKHQMPEGFSWTLLHRFDISADVCLNEAYREVESNSKLAVALSVMDECFLPLVDHRSGINLIHNIVYNFGSNFTRLNYRGFFTAILERGDEIISAASIRVHGNQLAEMPFIGTRYAYRRQGMCRRLLCAVESALRSLNVEKLVIPAISELRETWTSVFGFQPLETASKQKMRNMNMLAFPGVDMLQKLLVMHVTDGQMMDNGSNKSGEKCSVVFDLNVSAESPAPQTDERYGEAAAVESTLLYSDGTFKDTSDLMGENINLPESAIGCSCIPAYGEQKVDFDSQLTIPSEVKIYESIIKQNLDSKHEGSVKQSDDIVPAENEVLGIVYMSKVPGQSVVTNGFNGTGQMSDDAKYTKHHENSKLQVVGCVSDFDKMSLRAEVKNYHAIAKDVANQISPSALPSAQDVANGHYDASSSDGKSSSTCHRIGAGASGEVSVPHDVNSHPSCEVCDDTSKKENLQLCVHMSPEVVLGGSEVALTIICDPKETSTAIRSDFSEGNLTSMVQKNMKSPTQSHQHPVSSSQVDPPHAASCDSESFCISNSSTGVALYCASGGGESHGPEVIVLSNQAS